MTQPRKVSSRSRSFIDSRLDKQLIAYVAAAGAAGVGMLAAPQAAEGKIVYTPAHVYVGVRGAISIDLNNDGIADFKVFGFSCEHSNCLVVNPLVYGNGIKAGTGIVSQQGFAGAGGYGAAVGPEGKFLIHFNSSNGGGDFVGFMADEGVSGSGGSGGPWANSTNRYLGFQFLIDGKFHYGWARLSVNMHKNRIVLSGYAYETIPNHMIIEGHTSGPDAVNAPPTDLLAPPIQPASLGMLARGADGLTIGRRDDEAVAA